MTSELNFFIVGEKGAGKSSILKRFFGEELSDDYGAYKPDTIIEFLCSALNGQSMTVSFQHLLRSANGGFIVYDCTDQNSFNIAKEWVKTIERQSSSPLTLFLVANKSDVNNRVLSYDDGNSYALEKEFVYMDVSAKDNKGIADMFQKMISLTTENLKAQEKSLKSPKKKGRKKCIIV